MDLVADLNQATRSIELLSTSNPSQTLAAIASLHAAHRMLGSLLSHLPPLPPIDDDQPMADDGVEEAEGCEISRLIDEVEEGMRECVLQSKRRRKRRRRHASPSFPAGRGATDLEDEIPSVPSVDPEEQRISAIDLVFQFHA